MILANLREMTRPYHASIEKNRLLSSLLSPKANQEMYVKVLQKFYGFFCPLEKGLVRECEQSDLKGAIELRLKTALLEKDLACFGFVSSSKNLLPNCASLPGFESRAKMLGILYVTEGSTLGSQFIMKALKGSLGITPEKGGAFFDGYGSRTQMMWEDTCRIIAEFENQSQTEHAEIVSAAIETFDKLQIWFDADGDMHDY